MVYNSNLSDDIFNKIKNLIYKKIGVDLKDSKKTMVKSRLLKRLRVLQLDSFEKYCEYLNNNSDELIILYNLLTTNVTHFFREKHHFDYLKKNVLPDIEKRNNKKIRVWSAGCSSGQEVYTLSIVLSEYFNSNWNIKILGTDINTDVLKIARKGVYSKKSVENIPYKLLNKYFLLGSGKNEGFFKVKNKLKKNIKLGRLNLKDTNYPIKKKVDIIFCRNVFIYFDKKTRNQILDKFYRNLKKGGYLFLGHSESIDLNKSKNDWKFTFKTTYKK